MAAREDSVMNAGRRSLVTLVGPYSEDRVDLARALMDDGSAVVLCAGPPGCALLRGEPCAMIETADVTVLLPTESQDRKVVAGLSVCAENAPGCIVMEPSPVGIRGCAVHVRFSEMERVASFVSSVLHHPSSRSRREAHKARSAQGH
jgi:hypothetical protein